MLLNHIPSTMMLLVFFLVMNDVSSQTFMSGIVALNQQNEGIYTLNYDSNNSELIIAISSFTSIQPITTCYISNRSNFQANFTCSANILTISYLFYEKTPLIYSNSYTYYFFSGNNNYSVLWNAPMEMTIIQYPQVRAVLSGFSVGEGDSLMVQLKPLEDNKTINITRTLNVRVVNFSFILLQSYSPYNLTFVDTAISKFQKTTFEGISQNYLNFWGMQTLKYMKTSQNASSQLYVSLDNTINLLSIQSFSMSSDMIVNGLFLLFNNNLNTLNCTNNFYAPLLQICVSTCNPNNILKWNTTYSQFMYCLNNTIFSQSNLTYTSSNIAAINNYTTSGCLQPMVADDGSISCSGCEKGYQMYFNICVCDYGYYLSTNGCQICHQKSCSINTTASTKLNQGLTNFVTISLKINLPSNVQYLHYSSPSFPVNTTINRAIYTSQATFDKISLSISLNIPNIPSASNYQISIINYGSQNDDQLFYIETQVSFLWSIMLQTNITGYLSTQQLLNSIAPVFTNTDKSVPLIFFIVCLLGDKINAFSYLQTVSLIYLANFLQIPNQYNSFIQVLQQIFIFQPKPLFHIFGSNNTAIAISPVNISEINYDPLIYNYTGGQLFLSLSFNNIISLVVEIAAFSLFVKIIKKLLRKSKNVVMPQNVYKSTNQLKLHRSKIEKNGSIKWIPQIKVRKSAPLRYKLYVWFCHLDQKKYIQFTSLILSQLLSLTFFIFYQFTIPVYSLQALLSRVICYAVAFSILTYPLVLMKYEPLYLLKCVSVVYKRVSHNKKNLWIYFYLFYIESLLYPIIIITLDNPQIQISCIILVHVIKLISFKKIMKNMEMLRLLSIIAFFTTVLLACSLPTYLSQIIGQMLVGALLLVILCEFLKLVRSITVMILSIFKDQQKEPKQTKIIREDKQKLNPQRKTMEQAQIYKIPKIDSQFPQIVKMKNKRQLKIGPLAYNKQNNNILSNPEQSSSRPYRSRGLRRFALRDRN